MNEFFYDSSQFQKGQAADFFVFYNASRLLLQQKSIYGPKDEATPYMYGRYTYIPTFVFLIAWIGLLKPYASYIVWIILIELCLFVSINLSVKWKNIKGFGISKNFIIFLWLIPSPYYLELFMGQNTFLFATFIFLFLMSIDLYNNKYIEYISFALSVISKIASIIYIPIFIKKKQYAIFLIPALIVIFSSGFYYTYMDRETVKIISQKNTTPEDKHDYRDLQSEKSDKRIYKMPMVTKGGSIDEEIVISSPLKFAVHIPKGLYITIHHILRKPQTLFYPQVPGFSSFFYNITRSTDLFRYFSIFLWLMTYGILLYKPTDYLLDFAILVTLFFISFTFIWEHHYTLLIPFLVTIFIRESRIRFPVLIAYILISLPTPFLFYNDSLIGCLNMESGLIKDIFYYIPKSAGVLTAFLSLIYIKLKRADD